MNATPFSSSSSSSSFSVFSSTLWRDRFFGCANDLTCTVPQMMGEAALFVLVTTPLIYILLLVLDELVAVTTTTTTCRCCCSRYRRRGGGGGRRCRLRGGGRKAKSSSSSSSSSSFTTTRWSSSFQHTVQEVQQRLWREEEEAAEPHDEQHDHPQDTDDKEQASRSLESFGWGNDADARLFRVQLRPHKITRWSSSSSSQSSLATPSTFCSGRDQDDFVQPSILTLRRSAVVESTTTTSTTATTTSSSSSSFMGWKLQGSRRHCHRLDKGGEKCHDDDHHHTVPLLSSRSTTTMVDGWMGPSGKTYWVERQWSSSSSSLMGSGGGGGDAAKNDDDHHNSNDHGHSRIILTVGRFRCRHLPSLVAGENHPALAECGFEGEWMSSWGERGRYSLFEPLTATTAATATTATTTATMALDHEESPFGWDVSLV